MDVKDRRDAKDHLKRFILAKKRISEMSQKDEQKEANSLNALSSTQIRDIKKDEAKFMKINTMWLKPEVDNCNKEFVGLTYKNINKNTAQQFYLKQQKKAFVAKKNKFMKLETLISMKKINSINGIAKNTMTIKSYPIIRSSPQSIMLNPKERRRNITASKSHRRFRLTQIG